MKTLLYIVALAGYLLAAGDAFSFGISGENGTSGLNGRSGKDGPDLVINTLHKRSTYHSLGENGEDGRVGMPGRDAYQCRQPYRVRSNIKGADGGNAGHGGHGGFGGAAVRLTVRNAALDHPYHQL